MSPEEARITRAHAGAEKCRAAIAAVVESRRAARATAAAPQGRSQLILRRALERAEAERRAQREAEMAGRSAGQELTEEKPS